MRELIRLTETDSTNNELKKRIYASGQEVWEIVLAKRQTGGRGRLGRSFYSPEGGFYASFSLPLSMKGEEVPCLTLLAGLAAAQTVRELTGADPLLKWPNDLMLGGRKLGGILCELVSGARLTAVIGVGINLGAFDVPGELRDILTSLETEGFSFPSPEELARLLEQKLDALTSPEADRNEAMEEIRRRSYSLGRPARATVGGREILGVLTEILPTGAAVITTTDGEKIPITSGEIH